MQFDCLWYLLCYLFCSIYFVFPVIQLLCVSICPVINYMYHIYRRHHYLNSFFVYL